MIKDLDLLFDEAVAILSELVRRPSFSREEEETAALLFSFLAEKGVAVKRTGNNVIAFNKAFDPAKPTILLNSHHDTVKPNAAYTKNPFEPVCDEGKLFGLGSNDAGGCLVSLLAAFLHFYAHDNLQYNLAFAATAEEEISGTGGIQLALSALPKIDFAIVGEPTLLQLAVAERGLVVLDCTATGKAGHAAREEGENALYKALADIDWLRRYRFPLVSEFLGPVKQTVTVMETGNKAHNVVPATCTFVVDVRVNECYTLEEVVETISSNLQSEVKPRSTRLRSTFISLDHPLVKAGLSLGKTAYGSPTASDKALLPFPALKLGPGDSARSHTADEFIYLAEIREGIAFYIQLLGKLFDASD